jgi:hypothetical protein
VEAYRNIHAGGQWEEQSRTLRRDDCPLVRSKGMGVYFS